MARVPKKNIAKNIADIRPPAGSLSVAEDPVEADRAGAWSPIPDPVLERASARARGIPIGRFIAAFLLLAALTAAATAAAAYRERRDSFALASRAVEELYRGIRGESDLMEGAAGGGSKESIGGISIGDLFSGLRDAGQGVLDFQKLSSAGASGVQSALGAAGELSPWLSGGDGKALIAHLERLNAALADVQVTAARLTEYPSLAGSLPWSGGEYVEISAQIARGKEFLDSFIPWVANTDPHYVLVLLENPAELRPGGGFVGSFAVLTVRAGRVVAIDVHDVNDADRALAAKIVPPTPLQAFVSRWRAADANWFFDFPASAGKVADLIQRSNVFAGRQVKFDIVIGLSPRVVEDLLARTGPVALASGETLSAENFLERIQAKVQAGQAADAAYPKEVLRELMPLLLKKIGAMTEDDRMALADEGRSWIARRDVRLFSPVPAFERFFDGIGASGKAFTAPERFAGDYLAVAHANIGGEKSDLRMTQIVTDEVQLIEDGTASHQVTIERMHRGTAKDPWWYRAANQDYLQVMTTASAKLTSAEGGKKKNIVPKADYGKEGYERDPLITATERGIVDSEEYPFIRVSGGAGMRTFATWVSTAMGKKSTVVLRYATRLPAPLRDGSSYTFVFEPQSAAKGRYRFEINAPIGFIFRENDLPAYIYEDDDPPGRLTIELTLAPITL